MFFTFHRTSLWTGCFWFLGSQPKIQLSSYTTFDIRSAISRVLLEFFVDTELILHLILSSEVCFPANYLILSRFNNLEKPHEKFGSSCNCSIIIYFLLHFTSLKWHLFQAWNKAQYTLCSFKPAISPPEQNLVCFSKNWTARTIFSFLWLAWHETKSDLQPLFISTQPVQELLYCTLYLTMSSFTDPSMV